MMSLSAIELRRRAVRWPADNPLTRWVQREMFKLLLYRAIHDENSGLEIIIQSPDPSGLRPQRDRDRVCIVEVATGARTGTPVKRLLRDYALTCYLIATDAEKLSYGPGTTSDEIEGDINQLISSAKELLSGQRLPPMFEEELPPPKQAVIRPPVRFGTTA